MNNRQARKLAREIVDDIMTAGDGIKADRLILGTDSPSTPTLGAWGRAALFSRILGHLTRYADKPGKPRKRSAT